MDGLVAPAYLRSHVLGVIKVENLSHSIHPVSSADETHSKTVFCPQVPSLPREGPGSGGRVGMKTQWYSKHKWATQLASMSAGAVGRTPGKETLIPSAVFIFIFQEAIASSFRTWGLLGGFGQSGGLATPD